MPDSDLAANRVESEDDQVNVLGDQDADNLGAADRYPASAEIPTAQNVRRYPELFDASVRATFGMEDSDDDVGSVADFDDDDTATHVTSHEDTF